MKMCRKSDIKKGILPGRHVQAAVGAEGTAELSSNAMSMGWARFCAEYGPMEPHKHAEETMVIIEAKDAYLLHGPDKDNLNVRIDLEPGMVLKADDQEWHVFAYDEGGYVEIIYIYGQANNIRPEQVK